MYLQMKDFFYRYLQKVLDFKRTKCFQPIEAPELNCVMSFCKLLDCFLTKENGLDPADTESFSHMGKLWFFFW